MEKQKEKEQLAIELRAGLTWTKVGKAVRQRTVTFIVDLY